MNKGQQEAFEAFVRACKSDKDKMLMYDLERILAVYSCEIQEDIRMVASDVQHIKKMVQSILTRITMAPHEPKVESPKVEEESKVKSILSEPIEQVLRNKHICDSLKSEEIITMGDLIECSEGQIYMLRNIGKRRLEKIKEILDKLKLKFRDESNDQSL